MPDLDALRAERTALDPHIEIEGGCQQQMFLGDCDDCERWYVLDDQIRDLEMTMARR
jgi:hypothetical protein